MKKYVLTGRNAKNEVVKLSADVTHFTDEKGTFKITKNPSGGLKLITGKGVYFLKKHESQNIWVGICRTHKVHVSLKKVVGELRFW